MPFTVPPGPIYLAQTILPEVTTSCLIASGASLLADRYGYQAAIGAGRVLSGHGLFWAIMTAALIGSAGSQWLWTKVRQYLERRRLHAKSVPRLSGWVPGKLDTVFRFVRGYPTEYPGEPIAELSREYGSIINIDTLWEDLIWTDNPAFVKEMLATDFPNFVKGELYHRAFHSMLGNGIFNSDGEMWKRHRAMTRPFFTKNRVTDFDTFEAHAQKTLMKIQERCTPGDPVEFQDLASRFTLDSAAEFLCVTSVHSLDDTLPIQGEKWSPIASSNKFAAAFQSTLDQLSKRIRYRRSGWQLVEFFGDFTTKRMKVLYDFIDPIVDRAISEARSRKLAPQYSDDRLDSKLQTSKGTLLEHLVNETDDRQMIRDELLNIFLAGRDTTAATLTFVVYFMTQHPEILAKLREEIMQTVGRTQRPTFEAIKDMKYLRAIINETLRLLPPVPFNLKEAVESRVWVDPKSGERFYIPAGVGMMYSVITMHKNPELWGPDAHEFSPERWIDERRHYQLSNPFIFLPFQAGPRVCIGQQFAYNEVSFFLIRLFQRFSGVDLDYDAQPVDCRPPAVWLERVGTRLALERIMPRSHLTMYAQGGLWVKFTPAAQDPTAVDP